MNFEETFQFEQKDDVNFSIYNRESNKEIFTFSYELNYKLAIQTWIGYLEEEEIIAIYKRVGVFAQMQKLPIVASISDLTKTESSFHTSNEWVAKELIPESVKWGYKFAFFVKPEDFYAQLALEDAEDELRKIEGLKEVKTFEQYEDAYAYAAELLGDLQTS